MTTTTTTTTKRAVVLLSGGLDSATTLAIAMGEGFDVTALSVLYGQRHALELQCARRVAKSRGVRRHEITRVDLFGGSALLGQYGEVPKRFGKHPGRDDFDDPTPPELVSTEQVALFGDDVLTPPPPATPTTPPVPTEPEIPPTYVPARNTLLLALALSLAEVTDSSDIFIGANAVDYSGYPDCRPVFIEAFEHLANVATRSTGEPRFKIRAPLIAMTKATIIRLGIELDVDYSLTSSCYDATTEGACGACDSCVIRRRGFAEAGAVDPIVYREA